MPADMLREVAWFRDLPADGMAEIARAVRERRFAIGETLLVEGEPSDGLYVVLRGRVKVFKLSADGREQVLRILGAGRTFNDVAAIDGGPNPAHVAGMAEGAVGLVPRAVLQRLMTRYPAVATAALGVLAARLRAMTVLVEDLALRGVLPRVARLLLQCSRGGGGMVEGGEELCHPITQQQIAEMTGSVREVVQRALKTLEREGAVELARARVSVRNADVLEFWAGAEDD